VPDGATPDAERPAGATSRWFGRSLLTNLLVVIAISAIRPMVSYRALQLGATSFQLGLVAASYAVLSFLVAVPIGHWVDRLGEHRFVITGTVLVAAVAGALTGIASISGLVMAQAMLGVGQILTIVSLQSLVASNGEPSARDARFGLFSVVVSAGLIVGPALGGFVGGERGADLTPVFVIAAGCSLASTAIACSLWRWPPPGSPDRARAEPGEANTAALTTTLRLTRIPGMFQALLASLTVLASIDILVAYLPAFGELHAIPVRTVGLLLATQAAAGMTARALMLPLLRVLGRRWLLASSMITTAASLALVPVAAGSTPVLFGLMACAGVGLGLGQPITMSWVAGRAPRTARATALGVRLTANRLGQVVLPAAVGVVAGAAGVAAIFVALGAMLAASGSLVLRAGFGGEDA
jgi:MFS family permease